MLKKIYNNLDFVCRENNIRVWHLALILVCIVCYPLIFRSTYQMNMGILILMWACLGSSWNIFGGYTGQVSFGQIMFFGVGAYGTILPFYYWHITPWIGMFIGIACSVIVALAISIPIFKLSAQYFAIATMALGETLRIIAVNAKFTCGSAGVNFIDFTKSPWITLQFKTKMPYYILFAVILAGTIAFMLRIGSSRRGYYFRTIKANETAAESIGIDVRRNKVLALVSSAVIASLCGSIYVLYQKYIDPSTVFASALSTKMIIMAVLGGVGTIEGPLLGAIILIPLSENMRSLISGKMPGSDMVIYGILIIIIVLYQPQGLSRLVRIIAAKIRSLFSKKQDGAKMEGTT
jgi:branched-chain amino acid transport system permease protein